MSSTTNWRPAVSNRMARRTRNMIAQAIGVSPEACRLRFLSNMDAEGNPIAGKYRGSEYAVDLPDDRDIPVMTHVLLADEVGVGLDQRGTSVFVRRAGWDDAYCDASEEFEGAVAQGLAWLEGDR